MNKMSSEAFVMEKFDGVNYHVWSARMKLELAGCGVWSIVCGEETRPAVDAAGDAAAAAKQLEKQKEFDSRALRAQQLLGRAVSDEILMSRGLHSKPVTEAWKELHAVYASTSTTAQMFVKQRLTMLQMQEGDDLRKFLQELNLLVAQLVASGGAMDEKEVVLKILLSLPESWRSLVQVLQNRDQLTKSYVEERLLLEYQQRVQREREQKVQAESSSTAMVHAMYAGGAGVGARFSRGNRFARGRGRSAGGTGSGTFPFNCFSCGQRGHRARDCPLPRRDDRDRLGDQEGGRGHDARSGDRDQQWRWRQQTRPAAMMALDTDSAVGSQQQQTSLTGGAGTSSSNAGTSADATAASVSFLFTVGLQATKSNEWILDSGASQHMCNNLDHFVDYVPASSQHAHDVQIGDGRRLRATGAGKVRFIVTGTTLDGEPRQHVINLAGVLHIPELSASLFSIGAATQSGYLIQFSTLQCNIVDADHGVVVLQANRAADGLYKLQVQQQPAWSNAASPSELAAMLAECPRVYNPLDLWHQRLGHAAHASILQMEQHHMVDGIDIAGRSCGGEPGTADVPHDEPRFCVACIEGKQHAAPISSKTVAARATAPLELVHTDVVGPMQTLSHDGCAYFVSFVDDYSRCTWVSCIKQKSDVAAVFKAWRTHVEMQSGRKVKILRSDNGGEFMSPSFVRSLSEEGIVHQLSAPYTPQQNGVAERSNRTIVEMARAMLQHSHLSHAFWSDAVMTAAYIRNRVPHRSVKPHGASMTPLEAFTGRKPNVANIRVFGCDAYVLVPDKFRKKFDSKTHRCVFVGYTLQPSTYKLWEPLTRRVITSRNVVFNELSFLGDVAHSSLQGATAEGGVDVIRTASCGTDDADAGDSAAANARGSSEPQMQVSTPSGARQAVQSSSAVEGSNVHERAAGSTDSAPHMHDGGHDQEQRVADLPAASTTAAASSSSSISAVTMTPYAASRPQRVRRAPSEWWKTQTSSSNGHGAAAASGASAHGQVQHHDDTASALLVNATVDEPQSLAEAMAREDAAQWEQAVAEELKSIDDNHVYEWADLPPGRKLVTSKFVFRVKRKADGSIDRYKARLVARGFQQQEGIDYEETFAPVAKFTTIRTVLALAAAEQLEVHQMDVKTAFLNGDLEEEVFLAPPDGVTGAVSATAGKVWRLKKALYGLKQAPRMWNIKLHEFLTGIGFLRTESDHSLYVRGTDPSGPDYCILVAYVDDLLIAGSKTTVEAVKQQLSSKFTMTDMGSVQWLLGIQVQRVGDTFHLSQRQYMLELLQRFNMSECKPASTPLNTGAGERLTAAMSPATAAEMEEMRRIPYRSAVGSLMYLMIATRPDIAYAVGVVSRFLENPGKFHWQAVKHILRYVRGTVDTVLQLGGCPHVSAELGTGRASHAELSGYCDADWASDDDTRRSTTGYIFTLGTGAISWSSKRQPTVALSTTEAEYMSASAAAREVVWLRTLMEELGVRQEGVTVIRCDNQGAIALTRNPVQHQRSKHIDIRFHFIRSLYEARVVDIKYVPTHEQIADVLTKSLSGEKHLNCRAGLGLLTTAKGDYG